jgi:hypothetical protein
MSTCFLLGKYSMHMVSQGVSSSSCSMSGYSFSCTTFLVIGYLTNPPSVLFRTSHCTPCRIVTLKITTPVIVDLSPPSQSDSSSSAHHHLRLPRVQLQRVPTLELA